MLKFKRKNEITEIEYQLDDFMFYCKQKDLRPKTLSSYESTLRLFLRYLEDNFNVNNAKEVTKEMIKDYIQFNLERGKYTFVIDENSRMWNNPQNRNDFGKKISKTTINNYIRNIKVFFNYLRDERIITKNPVEKIKQLKNSRKPKDIISDTDFNLLTRNIDTTKFHEFRDYTIINLIFDTGMRLGECLNLTMDDIDIDRRAILIPQDITKGRKDRYVFYSTNMSRLLRRWLQYKDRYIETENVFVTKRGNIVQIANFETNFKKYCKRIGIKNLTPHGLRNNYARRFLMSGGDIYTLSRLLGHSSVTVTEKAYLDLSDDDIRKNYQQFSPLANLKGGRK